MSIDPYSSPDSHVKPPGFSANPTVSPGVLAQLAGTKPWVRFVSVLMFIGAGFLLLGAVGLMIAGSVSAFNGKNGMIPAGMATGIAIAYALFAFIYIYPALKLWNYASQIGSLMISGNMIDLESALSQQRSFWKFVGIMVIAIFALYFVAIIAVVAFGGFAAMKAQGV